MTKKGKHGRRFIEEFKRAALSIKKPVFLFCQFSKTGDSTPYRIHSNSEPTPNSTILLQISVNLSRHASSEFHLIVID